MARKLKSLKINLDDTTINQLVVFFKVKTSLDLYYRVGAGIIDNQKLKDFAASRSNAFISFFKNRIRKPDKPEDVNKEEITEKLDQLVFGKPPARFYVDDRAIRFEGDWGVVSQQVLSSGSVDRHSDLPTQT